MKNLIFLVIDSLGNKNCNALGFSPMPFLDELKKNSLYCPNMYSQAPYTEAAVMSMLCGRETMNEGGYFYRFRDAKTIFDYFHEADYHVVNYIQPHVYASSIRRSCDDYFYNVCHDFGVVFAYRLSFYANKIKSEQLNDEEYKKIIALLSDNFSECKFFFESVIKKDKNMSLIQDNLNRIYTEEEIIKSMEQLEIENKLFEADAYLYIDGLLQQAMNHPLFQIPVLNQKVKISDETKAWVQKEWKETFEDIANKTKAMNKKVKKFSFKEYSFYVYKFLRTKDKEDLKSLLKYPMFYRNSYKDSDLMQRIDNHYDSFKSAPSFETHAAHFYNWLDNRDSKKPYMACVHVDDIHNEEIFFSYDSDDKDILTEELEVARNILKNCDQSKTGSLTYFLSLAYIDLKIKRFVKQLDKRGILEDTCLVITGDHGFSFDDIILRPNRVNNFYLENYQIPFICYAKDMKPKIIQEKCSSKDILPTLLDMFHIPKDKEITGDSLLNETYVKQRKIITSEYVGGGCPEMDDREILICGHDEYWMVVASVKLQTKNAMKIKEVYHLVNDRDQVHNLVFKKLKDTQLDQVKKAIMQRYEELYDNYQNYKKEK
ncbi:MAG: sulfatase-like hydrolase/transferase [Longicatena sp.]